LRRCLVLIHCATPNNVAGHPFAAGNNTNGIGITSVRDYQVLPLDPRIRRFQETYVRKVVDTVQDLPNVLYEVANESSGDASSPLGDSTRWQYGVIDFIKRYERLRRYQRHPVGMTMVFPVPDQTRANDPLFNSPADWISPSFDDVYFTGRWFTNPPESDGTKVVISDTDHYASGLGEPLWAWKTFLRGHNPILMDFGIIDVVNPLDPSTGVPSFESYEPTRFAMGDTHRFARRMQLSDMEPHGDLSSTGYVLADPGSEHLVLQPADSAAAFTVALAPGAYKVTWYSVNSRHSQRARTLRVRRPGPISFTTPFTAAGPAVLHLKEVRR
jgi:hypothetical protein